MRISAAVLVGGHSRRMGRDKALLPAPPFRTLLDRQLALLRALGAGECLISARAGQSLPCAPGRAGATIVRDDGASGPLGGLVAVLREARAPHVFVLAVDAAGLSVEIAHRIIGAASESPAAAGVMPRTAFGPQPLAALWPRSMLALAEAQLAAGADLSLRRLVEQGIAAGHLRWFDVPSWDEPCFANWNQPTDIRPISGELHAAWLKA